MYVQNTERAGIRALFARTTDRSPARHYDAPPQVALTTTRLLSAATESVAPNNLQIHHRVKITGGRPIYITLIVNKREISSNNATNPKQDATVAAFGQERKPTKEATSPGKWLGQ